MTWIKLNGHYVLRYKDIIGVYIRPTEGQYYRLVVRIKPVGEMDISDDQTESGVISELARVQFELEEYDKKHLPEFDIKNALLELAGRM